MATGKACDQKCTLIEINFWQLRNITAIRRASSRVSSLALEQATVFLSNEVVVSLFRMARCYPARAGPSASCLIIVSLATVRFATESDLFQLANDFGSLS